jgi:hypothetical protein
MRASSLLFAAALAGTLLVAACSLEMSVPAPFTVAAETGENLYDAARADDWTVAAAKLDTLLHSAADLPAEAGLEEPLAALDTAVEQHDRAATLRGANEVTRLVAESTRRFKPAVPVEVTLLDYSGRELERLAEAGDLDGLRTATATLRQTWNRARPAVEKRNGGPGVAADFEALVARAEAAATPADYAAVATPILDAVDRLEQVFPG